jgi:allantoinase
VIVRSRRIVLPDGVRPATIHIQDGKITRIGPHEDWSDANSSRLRSGTRDRAADRYDAGTLVVSPGIVDTHVHINEPGRTDWEGFDTATRAAAAGGVTTVVDMPLNSVPATTTAAALEAKRTAARGRCHVDVAFWGGVVPGNTAHLDELVEGGIRGFKCFLVPSGVDEFPAIDERDLRAALPIIAARGVPLLVHAESPGLINPPSLRSDRNPRASAKQAEATYQTYLATRPPEAEVDAIRMIARLAKEYGARAHIVHVASAEAADEVARAKADGVAITAETCPHYLVFAAEDVPDGATEFKCAPPIREARHREALWSALTHGTLDLVATDHSPAPPALKCPGDFMKAWGGIASLELSLATVWTSSREVSRLKSQGSESPSAEGSLSLETSVRLETSDLRVDLRSLAGWMSEGPAKLAGLHDRKGRIAPGCDADLVVWDPDAAWTVDPSRLQQRHKLTPYAGRRLVGRVQTTFLRGTPVWRDRRLIAAGSGHLL